MTTEAQDGLSETTKNMEEITPPGQPLDNPKKQDHIPPAPVPPVPVAGYAIFKDDKGQVQFKLLGPQQQDQVFLMGLHELAGIRLKDDVERSVGTLTSMVKRKLDAFFELFINSKN